MFKQFVYHLVPWLKVMLFVAFIFLCSIPFGLIDDFGLINEAMVSPLGMEIIAQVTACLMVLGALLMIFRIFSQYHFAEVFIVKQNSLSGFWKGTLIGFTLLTLCTIIAYFTGNVTMNLGKFSLITVSGYVLLYLLVAVFEEFLFRSFPLLAFAERYPNWLSIVITSLLFGAAHAGNPGFTWLAMLNISLAGALFSILILIYRNIWWAIGIHFGWNFTQGVLMGYKVSGTDSVGILNATPQGSVLLSGGNFGIESSLICTFLLMIVIAYLLINKHIEQVEEVVRIDDRHTEQTE